MKKKRKNKKYKRNISKYNNNTKTVCHKSNDPLRIDISTFIHYYLSAIGDLKFDFDIFKIYKNLLDKYFITTNISYNETFIKKLLISLENEIRIKICKYDLYEMIYWSRRIKPENVFKCSSSSVFEYRQIMHLSFIKYCKRENSLVESEGVFAPKSLHNLNTKRIFNIIALKIKPNDQEEEYFRIISRILNLCYEVEVLSFYYNHLLKEYRIISKGGFLLPHKEMGVFAYVNHKLHYLLNLYDDRLNKTNILSSVGGYATLDSVNIDQLNKKNKFEIINYQENIDSIDTRPMIESLFQLSIEKQKSKNEISFMEEKYISNYVPTLISLNDFYDYSKNFKVNFFEYYNFRLEDFLVFIVIVFLDIFHSVVEDPHGFVHLLQRGYSLYNLDTLRTNYFNLVNILYDDFNFDKPETPERVFNVLFSFFNNTEQSASKIQLDTFGPRGIFYEINDRQGMVDHTSFVNILGHILDPIIKDNDMKGTIFENIVKNKVIELYGEDSLWLCQTKIKVGKSSKEIDVSFVCDEILYILECKAVNLSWGFFKGDKKAVEFRNMKNEKAITQADKTLDFLSEHKYKMNHDIPFGVKYITSLVITPHPEFIWDNHEKLFVSEKIPRILCLNELNYIKENDFRDEVVKRSFTIKL